MQTELSHSGPSHSEPRNTSSCASTPRTSAMTMSSGEVSARSCGGVEPRPGCPRASHGGTLCATQPQGICLERDAMVCPPADANRPLRRRPVRRRGPALCVPDPLALRRNDDHARLTCQPYGPLDARHGRRRSPRHQRAFDGVDQPVHEPSQPRRHRQHRPLRRRRDRHRQHRGLHRRAPGLGRPLPVRQGCPRPRHPRRPGHPRLVRTGPADAGRGRHRPGLASP